MGLFACFFQAFRSNLAAMSELLVDFISSLDGYGAAEGWPGWWGLESPEYLEWLGTSPEKDHTVLMGATTYRLMSGFVAAGEPGTEVLDGMDKIVCSNSLTEPLDWQNTRLLNGDTIAGVRALKESEGLPLRTMGSVSLCRSLLNAGLVDRFRVVVFPVVTGKTGQDQIYDQWPDVMLDLVQSRTFDGGLQLLDYVPRVLDGPPGH